MIITHYACGHNHVQDEPDNPHRLDAVDTGPCKDCGAEMTAVHAEGDLRSVAVAKGIDPDKICSLCRRAFTPVITWQAPDFQTISICPDCEDAYRALGTWPRNSSGEYCSVAYGLHSGKCDVHQYRQIFDELST